MTAAWDEAAMTRPELLPYFAPCPGPGHPGTWSCTDGRQGVLQFFTSTLQDRHIDDYKG